MSSLSKHSEAKSINMVDNPINRSVDDKIFTKSLPNGSGKENQDSYINWRCGNKRVFGVFDGHGPYFGKIISNFLSEFFIRTITERASSIFVNTKSKLSELFLEADEYFLKIQGLSHRLIFF